MMTFGDTAGTGTIREHFIAAETVEWDYAPGTTNQCYSRPYNEAELQWTTGGLGTTYLKALYVGYTDNTFTNKTVRDDLMRSIAQLATK